MATLPLPNSEPRLGKDDDVPTLYYWPGACSLASHIALEQSGERYHLKEVNLAGGEQTSAAYLALNPNGRVPALLTSEGVITETIAILTYIARRYPRAELLPFGTLDEIRCLSLMAWLASTVHPTFRQFSRPERLVDDAGCVSSVLKTGRQSSWRLLVALDEIFSTRSWIAGNYYSLCDPYALVFYTGGVVNNFDMDKLQAFTAWKDRMVAIPSVANVLRRERSVLL